MCFSNARSDVKRLKHLMVSRAEFETCAELRREVCYAFADKRLGDSSWLPDGPEPSVPDVFVEQAVHIEEAKYYQPCFDGPGRHGDACAKAGPDIVDAEEDCASEE